MISRIDDYQEVMERLEDAEDLQMLAKMRQKPLSFQKLEDLLAGYKPAVWSFSRAGTDHHISLEAVI
jgi:hypothetical protein